MNFIDTKYDINQIKISNLKSFLQFTKLFHEPYCTQGYGDRADKGEGVKIYGEEGNIRTLALEVNRNSIGPEGRD